MLPTQVRFKGKPSEYALAIISCPMLDCPCTEISFGLREIGRDAVAYVARVDVPTWQEVDAPQRPAAVSEMVIELLRDFPELERAELRKMLADKRTISQHLNTCCLPPGVGSDGKLMYFDEIVKGAGRFIEDGLLSISWRFEWQDREFMVQDSYCVNPACDCREVHLHMYDVTPKRPTKNAQPPIEQMLMATHSLDGKMTIKETDGCSKIEGKVLLMAWKERCRGTLDQLRWRYTKMKEIGRRSGLGKGSMAAVPERRAVPLLLPAGAVGRNDPCPCGSGLKYKKCCGR